MDRRGRITRSSSRSRQWGERGCWEFRDVQPLELYLRYHAAHDRAYQRASAEFQKRKRARQLAGIGFASQKRAQAEESRKAEKHTVHIATANFRKQREELKLAHELAKILPDDCCDALVGRVENPRRMGNPPSAATAVLKGA